LAIACWVRDTALQSNARELNYNKAFLNSIITTRTTMNTQVSGQHGYKKDNALDKKVKEAQNIYDQFKWIIK
jgi:hypothetical protein